MRRALLETPASPASLARIAWLAAMAAVAGGCANGSKANADDLGSGPVVALSDPGAPLPDVPELGSNSRAVTRETALSASTTKQLAPASPFAITTCKKGAFCDDFEEPSPAARWSSTVLAGAGTFDFPAPSSSLGAHALRAVTSGADDVAYLTRDGGTVGGQWVGVFELALRVDALPTVAVGGPELAVIDPSSPASSSSATDATRIGIAFHPDGLALEQHFVSCAGSSGCSARSDLVSNAAKPSEWRHAVLAVETYGTTSPPFGRIEVVIDGGDLIALPLTVPLSGGRAEARAGITSGDTVTAAVRVDDVTFYAHGQ